MANTLTKNGPSCSAPEAQVMKGAVTYNPRFDFWEDDDELVLYGDLPGVASSDLDIHFEQGELKIYGKVAPRNANVELLYGEYGIGDFHRSFSVSEAIDPEKIAAELKNGVLTVHLPKREAVKPRRIEVTG
jgi:HSP20 family molecular chaperone IbpA